jgi:hypothetical protein
VIRDVQPAGELSRIFFRLLRRARGHDNLHALFLKAFDKTEKDPGCAALIESCYKL